MTDRSLRRVVVVSPHLDDGVFSLGAAIAHATRRGTHVKVVTVFANDPASQHDASPWDAACGFATEGEAAAARREEDRRACGLVGADPVWLPLRDEEYRRGAVADEDVWSRLEDTLSWADAVLVPGFPLYHPDHAVVTRLVGRGLRSARLGLYVEQPYASWRLIGRGRRTWTMPGLTLRKGVTNLARILARTPEGRRLQHPTVPDEIVSTVRRAPTWVNARSGGLAWWAKQRAVQAYGSQLRAFGPLVGTRMALYELAWGGEGVTWIEP